MSINLAARGAIRDNQTTLLLVNQSINQAARGATRDESMKKCIGGVLVALFCPGFNDVVVVVSSSSLAVEHNTTPSGIIQDQDIIQDRDIIKDPDVIILKDPEEDPEDDHPPPTVGIRNVQPICPGNNDGGNTGGGGGDDGDTQQQQHHRGCAVREMLVSAMESDDRLQGKLRARACVCHTYLVRHIKKTCYVYEYYCCCGHYDDQLRTTG